MHVSTTPTATPITSGMHIASATDRATGAPLQIVAGRILETGVRDIAATGWELIRATHDIARGGAWGMVAFLRTGDAWTAVELLTKAPAKTERLWLHSHVSDVQLSDDVRVDAVWQVSHYGGDYTDIATEFVSPRRG